MMDKIEESHELQKQLEGVSNSWTAYGSVAYTVSGHRHSPPSIPTTPSSSRQ
jgi:hypothetical protein